MITIDVGGVAVVSGRQTCVCLLQRILEMKNQPHSWKESECWKQGRSTCLAEQDYGIQWSLIVLRALLITTNVSFLEEYFRLK